MPSIYVDCVCSVYPSDPDELRLAISDAFYLTKAWFRRGDVLRASSFFYREQACVQHVKILDWEGAPEADSVPATEFCDMKVFIVVFHKGEYDLKAPESSEDRPDDRYPGFAPPEDNNKTPMPSAKVMDLPNEILKQHWEKITFKNRFQCKTLHYLIRRAKLAAQQRDQSSSSPWSRLVLFHGPPGTGKTSISLALAQQLSIFLGSIYKNFRIVQIDAQSIFSKWFSESGKAVSKIFTAIEELLDRDEEVFLVVLIDEVESLASARQQESSGGGGRDEMRAVNALLVALDRLRQRNNILIFCTTNFVQALDGAFVDRVADDYRIDKPAVEARYEILRQEYVRLGELNIVLGETTESIGTSKQWSVEESLAAFQPLDVIVPDTKLVGKLRELAESVNDISGRKLRALPERSICLSTSALPCPIGLALDVALRCVVDGPDGLDGMANSRNQAANSLPSTNNDQDHTSTETLR